MTSPLSGSSINRRQFLKLSSAGTALLGLAPCLAAAADSANDRLAIGLIGAGGRASDLMGQLIGLADPQNIRITAVCDVWQKNRRAAAARVKERFGADPRQFSRFGDL